MLYMYYIHIYIHIYTIYIYIYIAWRLRRGSAAPQWLAESREPAIGGRCYFYSGVRRTREHANTRTREHANTRTRKHC